MDWDRKSIRIGGAVLICSIALRLFAMGLTGDLPRKARGRRRHGRKEKGTPGRAGPEPVQGDAVGAGVAVATGTS